MKKLLFLLISIVLIFTLVACSSNDVTPTDTPVTNTEIVDELSSKQEDETSSKENTVSSVEKKDTASKTQVKNEKVISYKDSKTINSENEVVGKNIDFNIGVDAIISINTEKTYSPIVVTSYSQLVEEYNIAVKGYHNKENFIRKYNETFFNNKAVILIFDQYGIGLNSNLRTTKRVTLQEDTLYVNRSYYNIYKDSGNDHFIDCLTDFITCIEVDKADLENVKYLSLATWEIDG